ncbi:MAG: hypothetical protein Q8Q97_00065 [bacterium]|nr:hypothetical protein [bacterium]
MHENPPPTVTEFEQDCVTLCEPDVTATEPVLFPSVLYVFETDWVFPESPSVPDQEYEYDPVPPAAEATQVAEPPVFIEVGETEQEAERVGEQFGVV